LFDRFVINFAAPRCFKVRHRRAGLAIAVGIFVLCSVVLANPVQAVSSSPTSVDTARFLTQSTFGPTSPLISQVQNSGFSSFLSQQFSTPATLTLPRVQAAMAALPSGTNPTNSIFQEAWWHTIVTASDQLRQRVAFALSEIFVVSANNNDMGNNPEAMATYWDLLTQDAFGNFRQLLEDVTLNPAMGDFLDMVHNDAPNPKKNTEANENYAREIMQLFTIGLYQLNQDGSQLLNANKQPIPTYNQAVVTGNAQVFTGWTWAQSGTPAWNGGPPNYLQPMIAFPDHHDTTDAKAQLNGATLPAGQTQAQDLESCLNIIFNHPNVGPFIARRLIQRLVTSNPSPAYVARIAKVFADNGQTVRGDLKAVVQAILLDPEARTTTFGTGYGHEREPIIRLANLFRAFNASASSGRFVVSSPNFNFGQAALFAPTVFNFFTPDYSQPGPIQQAGLFAPEFQITTDSTVITSANAMRSAIYQQPDPNNPNAIVLDLSSLTKLASTPGSLVSSLNNLLMEGSMSSNTQSIVVTTVGKISAANTLERAQTAVQLLVTSPEFVIEQ
jgi:uncharacterized protein (DUF1800 family)